MSEDAPDAAALGDAMIEDLFWSPLREALDLDPAQWTNLTRVVGLHLVLDRLLTLLIVARLGAGAEAAGIVEKMTDVVAELPFGRRLEVAAKAEWIPAGVAADLREVNRVRNRLLHFDPRRKRLEGVPEIGSTAAFRAFARRGHQAFRGIVAPLLPLFERAAGKP